jgi:hypothetical protein
LNVPANIETIRAALPDRSASVIYLRQVCRGTYCVACEDSTATCIRSVVVGMTSSIGSSYTANATAIRRDVLYIFTPSTVSDCAPRIVGLADEFTSNAMVVISAVASVANVRVECATDGAKFVVLPVEAV